MNDFTGKVVLLAGGLGTRLSEETTLKPKPMVEIGGRPLLVHLMEIYSRFGINEFIICAGYKGFIIKEYFANYALHNSDLHVDLAQGRVQFTRSNVPSWKIHIVDTGEHSMTGGRIGRIGSLVKDDPYFYLTYGDGLSSIDILASRDFHVRHGKQATMTAVRPSARFGSAIINNDMVTHFAEKSQTEQGLINGGFFVLSPKVLDLIGDDQTIWEQGPMQQLAAAGELMAYEHSGFWQPMDTLREKQMLEELWATGGRPWTVTGA
jgi:glucose-1-phosphate cytidylyltransferase